MIISTVDLLTEIEIVLNDLLFLCGIAVLARSARSSQIDTHDVLQFAEPTGWNSKTGSHINRTHDAGNAL
jgi:hypothetical protein